MISIINPLENLLWLQFVSHHRNASIFHHPSWLSVLHLQYGLRVFAVCSLNERGEIKSGIPFCEVRGITGKIKWISLPFSDMCRPLSEDGESLKEILDYCIGRKEAKQIESIEIRYLLPEYANFQKRTDAVVHTTKLNTDPEKLFQSFKKTQIQQRITKSQREGLRSAVSHEINGIDEFYELHLQTRKRLGVPIQPRNFFSILFDKIIATGLGYTVLIYYESVCVAAGMFCGYGNILTYKYSASSEKYLKLRPNNLMLWTAMQEAIKRGFKVFDFGRTDNVDEGLRKFKSGWGSIEEPLYYSYYPNIPSNSLFTSVKNNIVGPIIRHSPAFVCKWSGELLYKYFA